MDEPVVQTANEDVHTGECSPAYTIPETGKLLSSARPRSSPDSPEKVRDPLSAALCSACCIGLGQFYNGRTWEGVSVWIFFLVLFVTGIIFPGLYEFLFFIGIGGWAYGIYDAFTVAGAINKGQIEWRGVSELFFFPVLIGISASCAFAVYWLIKALT